MHTNMPVDIRTIEFGVRAVADAALFGESQVPGSAEEEQLLFVCITLVLHVPVLPSAVRPRQIATGKEWWWRQRRRWRGR